MRSAPLPTVSLWNPLWTILWSLLFTPVFGALLQKKNWLEMGRLDEASRTGKWLTAGLILYFGYIFAEPFLPDSALSDFYFFILHIAFFAAWTVFDGIKQIRFVRTKYGTNYHRKLWGRPLMFAGMVMVLWMAISLTYVLGLILGGVVDPAVLQDAAQQTQGAAR
jgi:hypothetical protein